MNLFKNIHKIFIDLRFLICTFFLKKNPDENGHANNEANKRQILERRAQERKRFMYFLAICVAISTVAQIISLIYLEGTLLPYIVIIFNLLIFSLCCANAFIT